jgi:glycosyltransferase involved in cell wall biosynthesis
MSSVTVAIPVLNGGPLLREVLEAVRAQEVDRPVELLVADSGSTDGSAELARELGAEVFAVERFSHGGTRNALIERARGDHVALLTQDAVPAGTAWLASLLDGFALGADVALVYGPYLPRPGTPRPVARELRGWFASLAPDGEPRVDRDRAVRGPSPAAFFTDANGCVARSAWREVPFREVAYAEDQLLAVDMLRAGYAKVFQPRAAVVHSHAYTPVGQLRRSFDEWRGLREVHGWIEPLAPRRLISQLAAESRELRAAGLPARALAREHARAARHHLIRWLGAAAGSRADRIPPRVRGRLSLERRSTFEPVQEPTHRA